jgi:predicted dehydrogenase
MDRRDFIKTASAMTALSYSRVNGANNRIGIGVVGAGRRGTIVSQAFLADGRADLRSICDIYDVHRDRLGSLLHASDHVQLTARHEDVLANSEVDAVLLAVPDHLHVSLGQSVLEAKKHLYIEKPTVHHWKDRTILEATAEQSGRVLQCGTQQRSGPHYIRAKQEIFASGKLGQVVFARAVWSNFPWQCRHIVPAPQPAGLDWQRFLGPAPQVPYDTARFDSWRYFPDYGGGLLADILTHWADVAQWMLDDNHPQTAQAGGGIYAFHDGRQNPDTVNALIQYKNWNLSFESSVLPIRNDQPSVFFEGTQGTLDLSREGYIFQPNKGPAIKVAAEGPLENAHTTNFLDAILKGTPVSATLASGIDACRPVQMALRSYWRKETVTTSQLDSQSS